MDTITKVKEMAAASVFNYDAIAEMIGMGLPTLNAVLNGKYKYNTEKLLSSMDDWCFASGERLLEIQSELKRLKVPFRGKPEPSILMARIQLHAERAAIIKGRSIDKTGMSTPTKAAASLQS
jgi:hypothetical protein